MQKKLDDIKTKVMNFVNEKYKLIKAQYDKDAAIYTIILAGVIIYGFMQFVVPPLTEISKNITELNTSSDSLKEMKEKLANAELIKEAEKKADVPVKIFEAPYKDIEVESNATILINQIISIIKENGNNKVVVFELEQAKNDDVKTENLSVLSLKIQMETTYEDLQNILNEIYLMDYLVKIKDVFVKTTLDENRIESYITFDLYIKTS